ncbi:MAG TPA: hypothetical protein VF521_15315, partial [Pyrinomonadaceae bacterium]
VLQILVTTFGYILLIVPGIIFSLMFSVSVPAAIVERLGAVDAMRRSYELTKGYKGLIFITYFLWWLLIAGLNIVITWSFSGNRGPSLDLLPSMIVQTAATGMLNSTLHVLIVFIYLGLLRERRSGFSTHTFTHGPEAAAG